MLQDLTRDDIQLYVNSTLHQNAHFVQLGTKDLCCHELVNEIIAKAAGVFLWVSLVVCVLLDGLINVDGFSELQNRLRKLPSDLESCFEHMLNSADRFYRTETAQILQVCLEAIRPLSVPVVFFLREEMERPAMLSILGYNPLVMVISLIWVQPSRDG